MACRGAGIFAGVSWGRDNACRARHGVTTNGAGLLLTWTIWGYLEVVAASGAGRVFAGLRAVLDGFLRAIGGAKMGLGCVWVG